ncbi:MAG: chemotaxis methyl-accepting protein methylase [Oceanicoccus sp.]|jgi:chemotaxis methyl-accepting protein methylase
MSSWSYQAPSPLSDEQYARWQSLLEQRTGICFLQHKLILQKGLGQRMREVGAKDYEHYYQQVSQVPDGAIEWAKLVDRIAVKETSFNREPQSFQVVQNYLKALLQRKPAQRGNTLELWSVGCSTGEEAYLLAMLAKESIEQTAAESFFGVTATDISPSALVIAKQGRYSRRKIESLPQQLRDKYFSELGANGFQAVLSLRQRLYFVQGNMLALKKMSTQAMDVIYCQNVLVYFSRDRQWQVLDALTEHLKPGGLLVIGPGEVMGWQHAQMQRHQDSAVQAYIKKQFLAKD